MKRRLTFRRALLISFVAANAAVGVALLRVTNPILVIVPTPYPITRSGLLLAPHEARCARSPDYHYCVDVNSYGFRGKDPVDDARCRVLVVGSSFVYGIGVYDEQTFTALLESDTVQPFNLGVFGATAYDTYDNARAGAAALKPDVLVVGLLPIFQDTGDVYWQGTIDGRDAVAVNKALDQFKALNLPMLTVLLPTGKYPVSDYEALAKALPDAPLVVTLSPDMYFPHDGHFTVAGNAAVARQIAPEVERLCKQVKH